jgi:hypothetical protein
MGGKKASINMWSNNGYKNKPVVAYKLNLHVFLIIRSNAFHARVKQKTSRFAMIEEEEAKKRNSRNSFLRDTRQVIPLIYHRYPLSSNTKLNHLFTKPKAEICVLTND